MMMMIMLIRIKNWWQTNQSMSAMHDDVLLGRS